VAAVMGVIFLLMFALPGRAAGRVTEEVDKVAGKEAAPNGS
jgi:hypothetical protein